MAERSVEHHTVVLERSLAVPPDRVFAAWSDPGALARWYMPGDGWASEVEALDFRVGGGKRFAFGPPGDLSFREDCRYEDIVPGERLVYTMTIWNRDRRITASLVTVELLAEGGGTRLVVTDQIAILDRGDASGDRAQGWGEVLDKLATELARKVEPA